MNPRPARRVGPAAAHQLFGFHDASPWNATYSSLLALHVEQIDAPPGPGDTALVGTVEEATGRFTVHDETTGWNFPQGARQLWLHDRRRYVYNCPNDGQPRSRIRSEDGRLLHEFPWGVATVSPVRDEIYTIDFGRVHRLGGYGHAGSQPWESGDDVRRAGGVVAIDVDSGGCRTVAGLEACRRAAGWPVGGMPRGVPGDYVTHVDPSPDGRRLALLHRMWVADGGMVTTLCVVDVGLPDHVSCVTQGSLSHFAWKDDRSIIIWGRCQPWATRVRGLVPGGRGVVGSVARVAKKMLRPWLGRHTASFLLMSVEDGQSQAWFPDVLTEDGHPSFCPTQRRWLLIDTYPCPAGHRDLAIIDTCTGHRHLLGVFQQPQLPVDRMRAARATEGIDADVLRMIGCDRYAFTRSGLHCDLHPRWRDDGGAVAFDSLHTGGRRIHVIDTGDLLTAAVGDGR